MGGIFWFTCPGCERESYAATDDFRHTDNELRCPFCHERFTDREALAIKD